MEADWNYGVDLGLLAETTERRMEDLGRRRGPPNPQPDYRLRDQANRSLDQLKDDSLKK